DYSRKRHEEAGYEFVYTPHITKQNLYETSGHLEWYADTMFPPMRVDEVRDEETGEVTRAGVDYYLKPMNCRCTTSSMHRVVARIVNYHCGYSNSVLSTVTKNPV